MKNTFREIIKFYAAHNMEFDAAIGDVDMPATFCFSGQPTFTDYCETKYGKLLDSDSHVIYDETGRYTDSVVVEFEDEDLGECFCLAMAGYCSEIEYEKLFGKESD